MIEIYLKMKFLRIFISSFTLLLSCAVLGQQDPKFNAKVSRKTLGLNEQLSVEFSVDGNGDYFKAPNFDGFKVVRRGQSVQHINNFGKVTQSLVLSFVLQPLKKGTLTIGEASISIDDKEHKTSPIQVSVTDPVKNPQGVANSNPLGNLGFSSSFGNFPFGFDPFAEEEEDLSDATLPELNANDVFVSVEVSKTNPFVNESISITYKLFIADKYGFAQGVVSNAPEFLNFVKEEEAIREWKPSKQVINGKNYNVVTLKQLLLYPQKAGKISLEPLSVTLPIILPTNKVNFYGQRFSHRLEKTFSGGGQQLTIRELPQEGKPADFSGAVGQFSLEVGLSKNALNANETSQADVRISGRGNFKLFDLPTLQFPSALEVYAPEQKQEITSSLSGSKGMIVSSYTIVPLYKGKYTIPPVSFSYFNPETEKYITQTSDELTINVLQGNTLHSDVAQNTHSAPEAFRYLKPDSGLISMEKTTLWGTTSFYLWWLLPLLCIPLGILLIQWYERRKNNSQGNHIRRVNRLARKYLSSAKNHLGEKDAFYEALEKGLHNYLKAKLHLETSELKKERIGELLEQKSVQKEAITSLLELLSNCEMARYSPYTQSDMQNDYQKASEVISVL